MVRFSVLILEKVSDVFNGGTGTQLSETVFNIELLKQSDPSSSSIINVQRQGCNPHFDFDLKVN